MDRGSVMRAAALGLACAAGAAMAAPPPPADVAVEISDRRITVSWTPAAGAESYEVAVRPRDGIAPLEWKTFASEASPYAIGGKTRALGGVAYEIRVAAVGADGESTRSRVVAATAPELPPAPEGAIFIDRGYPPKVGKVIVAAIGDVWPVNARSWAWFACEPDGSDCKVLPTAERLPARYVPGPDTLGTRLRLQLDYERFGEPWTAKVDLGVVGPENIRPSPSPHPECAEAEPPGGGGLEEHPDLETHLYALELRSAPVPWEGLQGGAIAPLCDDLIAVNPRGKIFSVDPSGRVERLDGAVPMNREGFEPGPGRSAASLNLEQLRVNGILPIRRSGERYELFVTHHYYAGGESECIRFRLSSTTVLRGKGGVAVSPSWRTIFDAEPCLPFFDKASTQAGGRMLADGRTHLLVTVGDHRRERIVQDPGAHLGKLLRIDIETGEAETLASGLRNPQGLARDAAGRVWWTEHGPQGGDELNLLRPGGNYGWPLASYGVGFNAPSPEAAGMHDGFAQPAFAWVPSIGVSALAVNDARRFPLWRDDLLAASLRGALGDAGLALFRIRRHETKVQYVERIPLGFRIRDMAWMPDGRIALLDDSGRVAFLRASPRCDVETRRRRPAYAMGCGPLEAAAAGPVTSPSPMRPTPP